MRLWLVARLGHSGFGVAYSSLSLATVGSVEEGTGRRPRVAILIEGARLLFPGYFALVMATGVLRVIGLVRRLARIAVAA